MTTIRYAHRLEEKKEFKQFEQFIIAVATNALGEFEFIWNDRNGEHKITLLGNGDCDNGFVECPSIETAFIHLEETLFSQLK